MASSSQNNPQQPAAQSKTFKLRMLPQTERKAFNIARFDVPKFDLANMAQPVSMVRQGFEDAPPPPDADAGSKKAQAQLAELRKKPFLMDDAAKKVKLAGQPEHLEGRYFLFVSDPSATETFNVIPVRDFYRFKTRPDLKQISIEEAEAVMSRRERAAPAQLRGGPTQDGADEDGVEPDVEMGGLSVYGYRVRDDDLDTEIRQGQEEAGEDNDFKEKFDDDNPEDIIQVASSERLKLSKENRQLKNSLRKVALAKPEDASDDSEDSEDEFKNEVLESLAQQPQPSPEEEQAAKNKKRKAEDSAESQAKRQKTTDNDRLTREEMLEEVKRVFLARGSLPKKELILALKPRVDVTKSEHNKRLFLDIVKTMVKSKGDGSEHVVWKTDLFAR